MPVFDKIIRKEKRTESFWLSSLFCGKYKEIISTAVDALGQQLSRTNYLRASKYFRRLTVHNKFHFCSQIRILL